MYTNQNVDLLENYKFLFLFNNLLLNIFDEGLKGNIYIYVKKTVIMFGKKYSFEELKEIIKEVLDNEQNRFNGQLLTIKFLRIKMTLKYGKMEDILNEFYDTKVRVMITSNSNTFTIQIHKGSNYSFIFDGLKKEVSLEYRSDLIKIKLPVGENGSEINLSGS